MNKNVRPVILISSRSKIIHKLIHVGLNRCYSYNEVTNYFDILDKVILENFTKQTNKKQIKVHSHNIYI